MPYSAYSGLELLDSAVVVLDHELRIVYLNPAAESLFELAIRSTLGQTLEQAFPSGWQGVDALRQPRPSQQHQFHRARSEAAHPSYNELHLICNATRRSKRPTPPC